MNSNFCLFIFIEFNYLQSFMFMRGNLLLKNCFCVFLSIIRLERGRATWLHHLLEVVESQAGFAFVFSDG